MLTAATAVFLLPWFLFVSLNGGIVPYLQFGMEVSRAEAVATMLGYWPQLRFAGLTSEANAEAWLFWLFWTLPMLCAAVLRVRLGRGGERWPGEAAIVGALIVLTLMVNAGFLRDTLRARLADAIVPVALLAAWALALVWHERWRRQTVQAHGRARIRRRHSRTHRQLPV